MISLAFNEYLYYQENDYKESCKTVPRIIQYLKSRIATDESPRRFGKALVGDKSGLWRYRVKDYRILCNIEDRKLVVLVLRASHRKNVYD